MKNRIIIDQYASDPLKPHEKYAAEILMHHFQCDLIFVRPGFGKTPDFIIRDVTWELKSPTGGSKNTIGNNLRKARHQAPNIILDLSRCKMRDERAVRRAKTYLAKYPAEIQRVIILTKRRKVIEIYHR